jgi:proteasome lid subunit RPN8/RPN11
MIRLDEAHLKQIRAAAERAYPEECCGLLVGRVAPTGEIEVTRVVDSPNIRQDRAHDRFEVDPKIRLAVERSVRGTDERVVGHYHSHPDHPARPSETDRAMAFEPELVWVIVAVGTGGVQEVRAYKLDETRGDFAAVEIA